MSAGLPTTRRITVRHVEALPADLPHAGRVAWSTDWDQGRVDLVHTFTAAEISDDAMLLALEDVIDAGALRGQWEFEEAAVGLIRTCSVHTDDAWAGFYDNSLRALRDGTARFAPVHRRARSLISGSSVLEVGCCFGFFALRCAEDGLSVAACDISIGAVNLLAQAARRRDTTVVAAVGDATDLDRADSSVDTVTLIHLLEHLPADLARAAIIEALRVARRRVVIAIPYEDRPSEHFGHLVRLGPENLHAWADAVDHAGAKILTDHGGWLVLTPRH